MSTRYNDGSHYENHQLAAELQDLAAHAHRVGEQQGNSEHLTGTEHTRQTHEHGENGHQAPETPTVGHGIAAFGHKEIAELAYQLWVDRGSPEGSAEVDWLEAAKQLRGRAESTVRTQGQHG
jgi:Protein of unknown function (DUF2934)